MSIDILAHLKGTHAVEALADAYSAPVTESLQATVHFHALEEDITFLCPAPELVLSFNAKDYLHIKAELDDDWLIGRVVDQNSSIGFLPSESRLKEVVTERNARRREISRGVEEPLDVGLSVYLKAPILRPLIVMGPSAAKFELTKVLQNALIRFLKQQFSDRLLTLTTDAPINTLTTQQARGLEKRVYEESRRDKLVLLECGANYPSDLEVFDIHPMIIYLQVNRLKVLTTLAKEHHRNDSERTQVLVAARQLYELPPERFSLVISDSDLDDACQNLELFVESYWAYTHPKT